MSALDSDTERRIFHRSADAPGIEMLESSNTTGAGQVFHTEYAIAIPEHFSGPITHEGRVLELDPGEALMLRPGEFHSTPGTKRRTTIRVLFLGSAALEQQLGEWLSQPTQLCWRGTVAGCSSALKACFADVFRTLHAGSTALQLQSSLAEFFALMVSEMVMRGRHPPTTKGAKAAVRMRELIHHSSDRNLGLQELANETGLTRFQALRAFKRTYGVPPHVYQLTRRVYQAMPLLRGGERVTSVAHQLGFADHSHFTRHFKRIARTTPRDYAAGGESARLPTPCTDRGDGVTYTT